MRRAFVAHFIEMRCIVEADAQDLSGIGDRWKEGNLGEGDPLSLPRGAQRALGNRRAQARTEDHHRIALEAAVGGAAIGAAEADEAHGESPIWMHR